MATTTLNNHRRSPAPGMVIAAAAALLVAGLLLHTAGQSIAGQTWTAQQIRVGYKSGQAVEVHLNEHAVGSHPEAPDVRAGCEANGAVLTYKHYKSLQYIFLCQLPDGKWGIMIIVKAVAIYEEVTSFIPGTLGDPSYGTKLSVIDYLFRNGTPYKGLLP